MHGFGVECWPTCMAAEWNVEEEVVYRVYYKIIYKCYFIFT